ncbi:MAG: DUF4157 domain-containing protein, partial [Proteobacteria bacterium]|nr:DUF4157 domain-containing protein [Pseudomonadota bacterium]
MALASAGVEGQAAQLSSNVLLRKVLRDALHLDAGGKAAVDGISRSGGRALPQDQLNRMNAAFEHDFSHVRVHTGGTAARASEALNAHAFTLGADIFFGAGEWAPNSASGDRLLAHELTHVLQHDEGRLPSTSGSEGDVEVSNPNESVELEAYRNEDRILAALRNIDADLANGDAAQDAPVAQGQQAANAVANETVESVDTAVDVAETRTDLGLESAETAPMIESAEVVVETAEAAEVESDSPMMADREAATPTSGAIIDMIKKSRGKALPGAVAQKLAALLGHDFSHVRVHTDNEAAKAADELNARAFALGADVFFNTGEFAPASADGQELLAHELTHVVQHDEGRLPSGGDGLDVSKPSDGAEVEARDNAAAAVEQIETVGGFDAVEPAAVDPVTHAAPAVEEGPVMRQGQSQDNRSTDPNGGQGQGSDRIQVRFGGRTFNLRLPSVPGAGETLRWSPQEIDLPGLAGPPSFEVVFGQDGLPSRGQITVSFALGSVTLDDVTLSMNADGDIAGGGSSTINIADLGTATADVSFDANGVKVDGTITAEEVAIPGVDWLTFSGGQIDFSGDVNGISAQGSINGVLEEVGTFEVTLGYSEGQLSGALTLTVQEGGIAVTEEATIETGVLVGAFTSAGVELAGNVHINVRDFCTADALVAYSMPSNLFSATIVAQQWPESFSLGEQVQVSETSVTVVIEESELISITGGAAFVYGEQWDGRVDLTYDATANAVSGTGTLGMTEDAQADGISLGEQAGGTILKEAEATVTVEENTFVEATGHFAAEVPYEELPTFRISSEELTYGFADSALSGGLTATTMRQIALGPEEGTQILIEEGASATGSMENNQVQRIDGGIPFAIQDPIGPIGEGSLGFEMPEGQSSLNAEATFTLTAPYGFPDRASTTAFFKEGGTVSMTMTEGELDAATVEQLDFTILNPTEDAGGQIDGSLSGSLAFDTGMVNAQGSAALVADWPIPVDFGELTLTEGGNISATIAESELTQFNGELPFAGKVNSEATVEPIAFAGDISGDFDKDEDALTGAAQAQLTAPVVMPLKNGDEIRILEGQVTAQFQGAEGLTQLGFNASAEYHRDQELFLAGAISDATYDVATGMMNFDANLALMAPIEKSNAENTFTFRALQGSEVLVEIRENALQKVGGTLLFEVDDELGLLLRGSVTEANLDLTEDALLSGILDVRTAREFVHPRSGAGEDPSTAEAYQFVVEMESGVRGELKDNEVTEVQANLNFRVDLLEQELARGQVGGTWDMTKDEFTGGGDVALTRDMPLVTTQSEGEQGQTPPEPSGDGAGRFESYTAFLAAGSNVTVAMAANELEKAQVDVAGFLNRGPERVAEANLSGQYKIGDQEEGFEGSVSGTVISRIAWSEGDRFDSFIDEGTSFDATMANSSITTASGNFLFSLDEEGEKKAVVQLSANYEAGVGITADGVVSVVSDIFVRDMGDGFTLFLAEGSGGEGHIENDELTSIGGTITLMVRKDGEDAIRGDFTATYDASQGTNAIISGLGTVEVLSDIAMGGGQEYQFTLNAGSGVSCQITESQLDYVEGSLGVAIADSAGDFLQADISGRYTHGQTDFTGRGSLTVTDEREMANSNGYSLVICEGGGAEIEVAKMELVSLSATIPLRIDNPEPLFSVTLAGTYVHADTRFDGTGEAILLRREAVAEDVATGDDIYSFYLEEGTTATATVENNTFKEATGTLVASVWDDQGEFLVATANGTYVRGETESTVSVYGRADITREKLLVEGDEYNVSLVVGSGAELTVEDNQLMQIAGTISTRVDRVGGEGEMGEFAQVDLMGTWTRDTGFNGRGSAVLISEFVAGSVGNYTLVVEPGAGAEVEMQNSEVTKIGGTIPVRLDEGELQFIRGQLTGDYVVATEAFSGNGSAEVINAKQLASLGDSEQLWLNPGTGANVVITDNELTEIGGQVFLSLRDSGGEYIEVTFGGRFDAAGGTGFTGGGSATVTRDKQLAQIGDYTFFLEPGAGASADVVENALTRVGGNVPFRVNDTEGPLLRGQAEGEYLAETGMFSGEGRVELARNLTFNAPGGVTLEFLSGSGGGGVVEDNELRRLTGTLMVNIGNADGPLIYLEAQGEFDAVNKNIERLEGTMRMLRPFELLDGAIIIENVSGSALVENNALTEASGGGTIRVPPLNDMTGTFNVNYSTEGGVEKYWGDGQLDFTLFNEPDKGRYMRGMVRAEYHRDDTFLIEGTAEYALNEMIGGTVGISVDQEMDPEINATLDVNTTLVPGKELFRKEMDIIPRMEINVYGPIALIFGAKAGMGLEMLPLTMAASIGISNWRPLAEDANVPDFDAELALNWGMNFDALVAAYLALGLSVGVASASAGIRGEVELDVPMTIQPEGHLHGGADGYWGELGIGIAISPTLALRVIPYVDAAIKGIDPFVHDFDGIEMTLTDIANFEWGTSYVFGDKQEQRDYTPAAVPTPGGSQSTQAKHEEAPNMGGNSTGGTAQAAGGPAVGGNDVDANDEAADQGGAMGEMMATIDKIKVMAEGIGALGELVGMVIKLVTAFLTLGPIGLIVMAVWMIFKGELSWDNIVSAIDKVVAALEVAAELLRPYLPDWMKPLVDAFSGDKPGLLDALFGADDKMRESVGKGEHKYANVEFRGTMINEMMSGWCGDEDEACIREVLEFSDSKGEFKAVVNQCEGGADRIMDKLSGSADTAVGKLMKKNGIAYSTGW